MNVQPWVLPMDDNSKHAIWWYDNETWKILPLEVTKDRYLNVLSQDFLFDVANWNVPWYKASAVIGTNTNISTSWGDQQNVSPQWWVYTFPASAVPFYISSSHIGDTANTFLLTLLDTDYNEVQISVTPNGQNAVVVPWGNYLRVNAWLNVTWNATQWDIYLSTSSSNTAWVPTANTILSKVNIDTFWTADVSAERFHNWVYTVPLWKTLFTYYIRAWLGKAKDVVIFLYIRPFWLNFIENIRYELFESAFENRLSPLVPIAEKTDIEFRATTADVKTELTMSASFILVDNTLL